MKTNGLEMDYVYDWTKKKTANTEKSIKEKEESFVEKKR